MTCSVLATQSPDRGSILYSRDELCKPSHFEAKKASSSGKICLASLYLNSQICITALICTLDYWI